MLVAATKLLRKMRGGAQAHLVEASDGHCYVVKFRNNPQHRRILINEWLASAFLQYLQISAPHVAVVDITEEFLAANPDAYMQLGAHRLTVETGWHFGSRFPEHPDRLAVYDFLPDALLHKIENRRDFAGILAFDKWLGNADARQAIFFRARLREFTAQQNVHPLRQGFLTQMIDHGFAFNGPHWDFLDSPLQGLYFRPSVYASVRAWDDFSPWLERIESMPMEVFDQALRDLPPHWVDADADALEHLLDLLYRRRTRVRSLIEASLRERPQHFPQWSA